MTLLKFFCIYLFKSKVRNTVNVINKALGFIMMLQKLEKTAKQLTI